MKAVYFEKTGAIENLKYAEISKTFSKLKSGDVRIQFRAGGLNHLDLWVLKGLPRMEYSFPHIAGADLCGEVVESQSPRFKKNDRVVVFPAELSSHNEIRIRGENLSGVFCDEVLISDEYVFQAPSHLSDSEVAAFPLMYLTAWQMITEKAGISEASGATFDEAILIHGAGSGVTQALLEILSDFKVNRIALTSRDVQKLAPWKERGIECFVNDATLEANLKKWAGSQKISVIFDHVGEKFFEMNIRLLKNQGKLIMCGATSGFEGRIDLRHLYFRQLQLLGSTMGTLQHFRQILEWLSRKKLMPTVGHEFSLADIQKAYSLMDSGKQNGKIILCRPK